MLKKTRATNPLLKNALRTLCAKSSSAEVFQALPDSAIAKVTLYEALDSTTSPKRHLTSQDLATNSQTPAYIVPLK